MLTGVASVATAGARNMGVDWATTTTVAASAFRHALRGAAQLALSQYGPAGIRRRELDSNVGQPSYPTSVGTAFFDMDNDTWLDILVANGHVYPQIDTLETGPRFREPLLLHRNNRDGAFDEVSKQAGSRICH